MPARSSIIVVIALPILLTLATCFVAQGQSSTEASRPPLRVATTQRIPYSWKLPDGTWDGPAIQLWNRVAANLGVKFTLIEVPDTQIAAFVGSGSADVAATGVQITPGIDKLMDFSAPFDAGGFSIVTHSRQAALPREVLRRVLTIEVMSWLGFMLIATVIAGCVIRIIERHHNQEAFGNRDHLVNGVWWAITTMSTVGYGDLVPKSRAGKLAAGVWMVLSLVLVTIFSANIGATLTAGRLTPYFHSIDDFAPSAIGIVDRPSSHGVAHQQHLRPKVYKDTQSAMYALESGEIAAFLHPTIELRALTARGDAQHLSIANRESARGFVALGLSESMDHNLAREINEQVILVVESPEWNDLARQLNEGLPPDEE